LPGDHPDRVARDLLGKWSARIGPTFQTEWTFTEDGMVASSRGEAQGTWRVEKRDGKTVVRIDWPKAKAWEMLNTPLDPKKTTGVSSLGPGAKIEANKVEEAKEK